MTDTTAPTTTGTGHLVDALEAVREWRHRQPHHDAARYAELDAILDAAAIGEIEARVAGDEPASLHEAVEAHHALIHTRRRAFEDARRAWDQVEHDAMRRIAQFLPPAGRESEVETVVITPDTTAWDAAMSRAGSGD